MQRFVDRRTSTLMRSLSQDSGAVLAALLVAGCRQVSRILPDHPHTMRVIRQLWDSTEAYRALYYNAPAERHAAIDAHDRILAAARRGSADTLVAELDAHRDRALRVLRQILERKAD